jgi:uncharacterized protein (TIGR02453 family)
VNKTLPKPHLSPDLPGFLSELARHNDKNWFDAHRALYQEAYVAPALALIAAMAPVLARLDPPLEASPKVNGSLRRINRDVRFSPDKRPYSTTLHIVFWAGPHPNRAPGVHFAVAPDHFGFGAGHWAFEPARLEAYRQAVSSKAALASLTAALATAEKAGCFLDQPQLARVPRGYDAGEPAATYLRCKGLLARSKDLPIPKELFAPGAEAYFLARIKPLLPLVAWLNAHVMG